MLQIENVRKSKRVPETSRLLVMNFPFQHPEPTQVATALHQIANEKKPIEENMKYISELC